MASVRELHSKAMKVAQDAMIAKQVGSADLAKKLYGEAFLIEKKAAFKVPKERKSEPTRSIIFRSAASLAFQAGELSEAIRMIGEAFTGYPNKRTFNELNILHEEVKLAIYNRDNYFYASPDQFTFHLTGNAVSYGSIYYKEFLERIDALQKSLRKTASRLTDVPFDSRKEFLVPTLHSPTPGSFSIKISLSVKHDTNGQVDLVLKDPTTIIQEFVTCIKLVQDGEDEVLFDRIVDEDYRTHFLSQVKKIAPDGDKITSVDFIMNNKMISLRRLSNTIPLGRQSLQSLEDDLLIENIEVTGILDYASSRSGDTIGITDVDKKRYNIKIEDGIEDYVRSYYKRKVCIEGSYDQTWIYPVNITQIDE